MVVELLKKFGHRPQPTLDIPQEPPVDERRIIDPAEGEEKTRLENLARELTTDPDFNGEKFDTFTETMIELVGGVASHGFLSDSRSILDEENGLTFHLERIKPHGVFSLDYSRIMAESVWTNLPREDQEEILQQTTTPIVTQWVSYGRITGGSGDHAHSEPDVKYEFHLLPGHKGPTFPSFIDGDTPMYDETETNPGRELRPDEAQAAAAKVFSLYEKQTTSGKSSNNAAM